MKLPWIALATANFYRSMKELELPHGVVKSHSQTLDLVASFQMSEEQQMRIDAKMEYLRNNIPCGWR